MNRRLRRVSDLRRPQLTAYAPVLQRGAQEWQVGLEPGRALVLRGRGIGAVLDLLDGCHTLAQVQEQAREATLPVRQLDEVLAALLAAGLLGDRPGGVASSRVGLRLIGAGPIGAQVARLLTAEPVASLHVFDNDPPELTLYPRAGAAGTRAQALVASLEGRGTVLSRINHWSKPDAGRIDLTVVSTEAPEVDRLVTDHLLRMDQPHLLVRCSPQGVRVGPLVVPGQTSCVRCADLARSAADPQWPTVLTQLVRLAQPPPPVLISWAASVAAVQALAFLATGTAETAGATLEIGPDDLTMRWRAWPPHPGCGCGWSALTEWGA